MSGALSDPFQFTEARAAVAAPVLVTSPHSGRDYPQDFLDSARLDAHQIRLSEDMYVDELFADAPAAGAALLAANYPRAYVDLNRAAYELEPALFDGPLPDHIDKGSMRAAAGLGTVPRLVAENMPIYAGKLNWAEAARRIEKVYKPFHARLKQEIDALQAAHGFAVLIDAHSMPSQAIKLAPRTATDFVIGTRHGRAAAPQLVDLVGGFLQSRGWKVAFNKPYAGGQITEHYGTPLTGRHALQIEINRALYMDEASYAKHDGFAGIRRDMSGLVGHIISALPALAADLKPAVASAAE